MNGSENAKLTHRLRQVAVAVDKSNFNSGIQGLSSTSRAPALFGRLSI